MQRAHASSNDITAEKYVLYGIIPFSAENKPPKPCKEDKLQ